MMAGMIKYKAFVIIHPEKGGQNYFLSLFIIFLTPSIVPSIASLTSLATSLTFAAAFSAAPSFSIFLSLVNLPTPSFAAPLA